MITIKKWLFNDISLTPSTTHFILYVLFFFSGCSALIYQVIWQRMLFTLFGVDLESITIIVSVFMFGLSIGLWTTTPTLLSVTPSTLIF